jgi:hypothetical protein
MRALIVWFFTQLCPGCSLVVLAALRATASIPQPFNDRSLIGKGQSPLYSQVSKTGEYRESGARKPRRFIGVFLKLKTLKNLLGLCPGGVFIAEPGGQHETPTLREFPADKPTLATWRNCYTSI